MNKKNPVIAQKTNTTKVRSSSNRRKKNFPFIIMIIMIVLLAIGGIGVAAGSDFLYSLSPKAYTTSALKKTKEQIKQELGNSLLFSNAEAKKNEPVNIDETVDLIMKTPWQGLFTIDNIKVSDESLGNYSFLLGNDTENRNFYLQFKDKEKGLKFFLTDEGLIISDDKKSMLMTSAEIQDVGDLPTDQTQQYTYSGMENILRQTLIESMSTSTTSLTDLPEWKEYKKYVHDTFKNATVTKEEITIDENNTSTTYKTVNYLISNENMQEMIMKGLDVLFAYPIASEASNALGSPETKRIKENIQEMMSDYDLETSFRFYINGDYCRRLDMDVKASEIPRMILRLPDKKTLINQINLEIVSDEMGTILIDTKGKHDQKDLFSNKTTITVLEKTVFKSNIDIDTEKTSDNFSMKFVIGDLDDNEYNTSIRLLGNLDMSKEGEFSLKVPTAEIRSYGDVVSCSFSAYCTNSGKNIPLAPASPSEYSEDDIAYFFWGNE